MTPTPPTPDLLARALDGQAGPFALLHRPHTTGPHTLEVLTGTITRPATLADIPLPDRPGPGAGHEVLVLMPYRQLAERGFACADDGTQLLAMTVTGQQQLPLDEALSRIPDVPTPLSGGDFDVDDAAYEDVVRRITKEMIGTGEGANFVIKRTFLADITDYGPASAPALFRRLLNGESGAHWTFLIHTGERILVGASPERHVSLKDGTAVMNPISGTYRYPPSGSTLEGVLHFLGDRKETDELYMVLDEELKMMARICDTGGRVVGPYLKEMARLAHTEYFIEGRTDRDVRDILRETMFAPTVTGSPLESACRIIHQYEPGGRGYYSGAAALIGRDESGERVMDSAILIRTADINDQGRLAIGVGATIVRHSDPASEAAETRAKAAGLVAALGGTTPQRFADHPQVRRALQGRNDTIAGFWLSDIPARAAAQPDLAGRRVLVVDMEDTFTSMIDQQLRSLGLDVTLRRYDEAYTFTGHDLVVMGPGPGDPQEVAHPKMAHLHTAVATLLREQRPFLAVCLSHQVLGLQLGLRLRRREVPNQGVQKQIDLFGAPEHVGYYNTFALLSEHEEFTPTGVPGLTGGPVQVSRDPHSGEVHALRGPGFASLQFHPESVLTREGPRIVGTALAGLLAPARTPDPA
ncbi:MULTISPECIES: chorismate-binding protein [Streptomyces]|uniref:anthranilate synthase n=1 Tax=Streptomyces venezuelae TaxID=54571 RepID=A0A5P2B578_STRVZ|nr:MULTISPECIES: chorismate-binding protein [Streptomyces]NEA06101.1 phenazine-specific anthranilate synthase component I [Streptomyces sp. SID10116]MYY80953.1 phenazine-specific anthranilate synthase component I [Streptomyces sp. SID335]MYZ13653.1 phenazine-specific anthranilate synthase component I [Streptomyces sp. SID337]NDZ84743.1 phenazine-specific anthranilate synthase component I [Streptomyces sp. SID10115]NDZ85631.1 phenazine-specific anthranilate synthase component I [Streptomyces sp